jgi:hypothetical protein
MSSDIQAAIDRGKAVDQLIQQMHSETLLDHENKTLHELMLQLGHEIGNAQLGTLKDNRKATLAFLIRAAALIRYMAVDGEDLSGLVDELGRK